MNIIEALRLLEENGGGRVSNGRTEIEWRFLETWQEVLLRRINLTIADLTALDWEYHGDE